MTRIEKFLLLLFIYLIQTSTASALYVKLQGLDGDNWLYGLAVMIILVTAAGFIWWPRAD